MVTYICIIIQYISLSEHFEHETNFTLVLFTVDFDNVPSFSVCLFLFVAAHIHQCGMDGAADCSHFPASQRAFLNEETTWNNQ